MKNSRIRSAFAITTLTLALAACQSEIDDKTAATVDEPKAPAADTTSTEASAGTQVAVSRETSRIEFVGAKVTRDHTGGFTDFSGSLSRVDGKPASVSFEIVMDSIFTDTPKLTAHLKTADFFDVAQFPKASFKSSSIADAPAGSKPGETHVVGGTLAMHGVEKAISFPVAVTNDATGVTAKAEFTINRQDWGVAYKGMPDDLVKDDVLIRLDMKFPPAPATPAPPATPAVQG
jgi:polyisoprenoid-binding protein YceI